ncbi:MAG TPA: efflux RND transporter permease subunit [Acidobacteriota bacterium]|nr:efflux RND transporter permease subunit [Acidobacteriota bacterium]HQO25835.1 efflux RND transporter permease subunit [Acidobacteriota bacterium]HQP74023.1 efflux RND transporter permease subunit [Acidobacteriota bacterium]
MNLSELSIRRPVTVIMLTLMAIILGIISIFKLPLLFMPEISFPSLRVQVDYPSSSPEEVEQDITRPIEDILGTVTELKSMSSSSSGSGANVMLEFDYDADMDLKSLEVRDKIDQVRNLLPSGVRNIYIRRWQTTQSPILHLTMTLKQSRDELNTLMDNVIRPRLERIDGVANVDVRGLDQKDVYIDINPDRVQAFGLDVYTLGQSLRNNNLDLGSGHLYEQGKKYFLRTVGRFQNLEEIRDLPIRGTTVRVRDVADVRYAYPERTSVYHFNGQDAVTVRIFKASTANVVEVCQSVTAELEQLHKLPELTGLEYRVFRDSSEEILGTISDLSEGGMYGGLLALVIMFLFLWKVRSTFILSISMPICVVFTFAGMYALRSLGVVDISINIISLMGMVFAVGMIVDSSIVVLENIFRHKQEEGLNAMDAARVGSREVGMAVTASTLTTIIVFVPLLFASQSMFGKFMSDFGVAVTLALVSSLVVSLTLVPMIASRIYTGQEKPKLRLLQWITQLYGRFMAWTLRGRYVMLLLLVPVLWFSFWLFSQIEQEDMPRVAARELNVNVLMPSNYNMEEMAALFDRIEGTVAKNQQALEVETYTTSYGKERRSLGRYSGELSLYFTEEGDQLTSVDILKERMQALLPAEAGVEYQVGAMRHFGGSEGGFNVELRGDNREILALYAEQIKTRLMSLPEVKDVTTDLESGDQELHFRVNRVKAESLGLTPRQVAQTISGALSERATTRYNTEMGEVDVIVRFREADRKSIDQILNLKVAAPSGELVTLSTVAQPEFQAGPRVIRKENRKQIVSISANTGRSGMMWLQQSLQDALGDLELPPGYSWEMGRSFRRFAESQEMQTFAVWLALLFIFIIMASLFESLVQPMIIMITVPFAITGVSLTFWLTGTSLSSTAYLGIMLMCGVVVNNAIILVDHVNILRREKGLPRLEALVTGGKDRLRPILMTAMTTIFGLLPMILPVIVPQWFGAVSFRAQQYAPVALALFGGLTTSTFLTLVVVPTLYLVVEDLRDWTRRVVRRAVGHVVAPDAPEKA